jgi:hypothetical protein
MLGRADAVGDAPGLAAAALAGGDGVNCAAGPTEQPPTASMAKPNTMARRATCRRMDSPLAAEVWRLGAGFRIVARAALRYGSFDRASATIVSSAPATVNDTSPLP